MALLSSRLYRYFRKSSGVRNSHGINIRHIFYAAISIFIIIISVPIGKALATELLREQKNNALFLAHQTKTSHDSRKVDYVQF